ncbi:sugar ABC transporter substrate-binding protein [Leucobacter triazinivorans]|uniref:Sugar ABC transporter substrate-binding protein n=1 Tax=Leucobacter triazinivorans TaxID=1784719 RepID=A0A4P6KF25_9MICO|nr:sugar ABC transporter substrate-binding protein [Leucobacter triazinivorans]QBE49065.1 sugar ABC transporter substrate-binding protein [Leucobacter triazinivorans]
MDRRTRTARLRGISAAAIAVGLALTGCASTGGADATGTDGGTDATAVSYRAADGSCDAAPREGVAFDEAETLIESFRQQADSLLQTEPLPAAIPEGTTVAFLNNDTPVASLMYENMVLAAEAAGVELQNVSTGTDAQSINSALNSVVESDPDILISTSVDAVFFQDQLTQLQEQGTSIVYASQMNAEEYGLDDTLGGYNGSLVNGELLAASAIAFTCGTGTDFVYYNIPELSFSAVVQGALEEKLAELCADCTLRVVDISILESSPADAIVSDLQANPDTDFFVTTGDQFQIGLQEKAELAGLTNAVGLGQGSLPQNIQQTVDGQQIAAHAVDFSMFMWALLDEGLRKQQDVWTPYTDWQRVSRSTSRVLTQENAGEFVAGFVAFPGMEDAYMELWGV